MQACHIACHTTLTVHYVSEHSSQCPSRTHIYQLLNDIVICLANRRTRTALATSAFLSSLMLLTALAAAMIFFVRGEVCGVSLIVATIFPVVAVWIDYSFIEIGEIVE
jgi:hypothetical protein